MRYCSDAGLDSSGAIRGRMREETRPTREHIFDEVRATLTEIGLSADRIRPDARLVDDLELDSLDWVDLGLRLEDKLEVSLRDEKLAVETTIGHVVDLVHGRLLGGDAAG